MKVSFNYFSGKFWIRFICKSTCKVFAYQHHVPKYCRHKWADFCIYVNFPSKCVYNIQTVRLLWIQTSLHHLSNHRYGLWYQTQWSSAGLLLCWLLLPSVCPQSPESSRVCGGSLWGQEGGRAVTSLPREDPLDSRSRHFCRLQQQCKEELPLHEAENRHHITFRNVMLPVRLPWHLL